MQRLTPNHDRAIAAEGDDLHHLIRCLQSLTDGQSAVGELVACGARAVPALRDFLLFGRISSVYQPRVWAVEALAGLQAREVLIEYLQAPVRSADPQLLFSEEAVRNAAARYLGAWKDERTLEVLLSLCRRRALPGVIESLAGFERLEAVPCLDRALQDDLCRAAAEEGLRNLGRRAQPALVLSALTPLPNAEQESPSSVCRRRVVLGLLTETGVDRTTWQEMRRLLGERDPELLVRIAQLASAVGDSTDRRVAAAALVSALERVPWHVIKDAETACTALAPESVAPVRAELERRSARPAAVRAGDEVLRLLLRVDAGFRVCS